MNNNKVGVLLINLGTPSAPTTKAIRKYLAEFLSDSRVITLPKIIWLPILHGIVLRIRPRKKIKDYQKIWTEEGSPLLSITCLLQKKLQQQLDPDSKKIIIKMAMRYGEPSVEKALNAFKQENIERILVLPLYPQYSAATTASVFDAVSAALKKQYNIPALRFIHHYYNYSNYIDALAHAIQNHWQKNSQKYFLLFSFHGLPESFIQHGDPYQKQCLRTAELVAEKLQLHADQWQISFQSRFGANTWIKPYTDVVLKNFPKNDRKNISVICPGFAADCLETLEEIQITNRKLFLDAGGESFHYIPALNAGEKHIQMLASLVNQHLNGWL